MYPVMEEGGMVEVSAGEAAAMNSASYPVWGW
jgi:hypothetical protein